VFLREQSHETIRQGVSRGGFANLEVIGVDGARNNAGQTRIGAGFVNDADALNVTGLKEDQVIDAQPVDVLRVPGIQTAQRRPIGVEFVDVDSWAQPEEGAESSDKVSESGASVRRSEEDDAPRTCDQLLPWLVVQRPGLAKRFLDKQPAKAMADKDGR
jgi:hypothetical protein